MFVAIKDSKIIAIHEEDWRCRLIAKGLDKPNYWKWLETVTSGGTSSTDPPVYDYSGEDYTLEDTNVNVEEFTASGHIVSDIDTGTSYHLKWDSSKKEVVEDDDAKTAWELSEEWKLIRAERDRLLAVTDWMTCSDSPAMSDANKTYRQKLRDLPEDQKDKTKYSDEKT